MHRLMATPGEVINLFAGHDDAELIADIAKEQGTIMWYIGGVVIVGYSNTIDEYTIWNLHDTLKRYRKDTGENATLEQAMAWDRSNKIRDYVKHVAGSLPLTVGELRKLIEDKK